MTIASGFLILFACAGLCGFALLLTLVLKSSGRGKERQKRLEILEEALRSGDMDPQLRREVVGVLKSEQSRGFSWMHVSFSLGWIGLFVGGGLLFMGHSRAHELGGWLTLLASLAIVTLPLAIKELEARRAPDRGAS